MSRKRLSYSEHVVEATSLPLRDGGFTVHFFIEDHTTSSMWMPLSLNQVNVSQLMRKRWQPESN
jgi:hypothetical protein